MNDRLKASFVIDALLMAYWRRKPAKDLIHHSDRVNQYVAGISKTFKYLWYDLQYESKG